MKPKYRIYVLGPVPSDLKERIVAIRAAGILKENSDDLNVSSKALICHYGKPVPCDIKEMKKREFY